MARFIGQTSGTAPTTSAPYTSGVLNTELSDRIVGGVFCDTGGTLIFEGSLDNGANWDFSEEEPVIANEGLLFSKECRVPFLRIRFVPGDNNATTFRLAARFSNAGPR